MRFEDTPYQCFVGPGTTLFPDFSTQAGRDGWAGEVRKCAANGLEGVCLDMNDPSTGAAELDPVRFGRGQLTRAAFHKQYAAGMAKSSREGLLAARPDRGSFLLCRWGFIGSKCYTVLWTGDNMSNHFCLMPYLCNLWMDHEKIGEAVLRPLLYDFDGSAEMPLDRINDQFMVGPAIMQAPITQSNRHNCACDVVLPAGDWHDLRNGEWLTGPARVRVETDQCGDGLGACAGNNAPRGNLGGDLVVETAEDLFRGLCARGRAGGQRSKRTVRNLYMARHRQGVALSAQRAGRGFGGITIRRTLAGGRWGSSRKDGKSNAKNRPS